MKTAYRISRAALLPVFLAITSAVPGTEAQSRSLEPAAAFDVNDVSFLFPLPKTPADSEALIALDEKLADGVSQVLPEDTFRQLMNAAVSVEVKGSSGRVSRISFPNPAFNQRHTWKVAGIRIHPAALGAGKKSIEQFGAAPTVRLVVQPVTVQNGAVRIHDFAAHIVFNFVLNPPEKPLPFIPDREAFGAVIEDLKRIKSQVETVVQTEGPLDVHPGFKAAVPGFQDSLRALVKNHLTNPRLSAISFMGLESPEPWIFFPMRKQQDGSFASGSVKGGFEAEHTGQMLTFRGGKPVAPEPVLNVHTGQGINTAPLFDGDDSEVKVRLNERLFPGAAKPGVPELMLSDVPDLIAHPELHHNFNTDCVSCHTETGRRRDLNLPSPGPHAFKPANGISGVAESVLPKAEGRPSWNLRNFGWGINFFTGRTFMPTVSQRAANEAAESADFINREYLKTGQDQSSEPESQNSPAAPSHPETPGERMKASPLTLVMDIKSPEDFQALKEILARMEAAPLGQNPIRSALDRLGLVHFARFVFLNENQLAVITSFDGEFDVYIDAFTHDIGHVFDALLAHMKDAPPLPVRDHPEEFLKYVQERNLKSISFYSAYPDLTTQDILTLRPRAAEDSAPK